MFPTAASPLFKGSRYTENSRLFAPKHVGGAGYGSVLSLEVKHCRQLAAGQSMATGNDVEMHLQEDSSEPTTYRYISARSVRLPKEKWYKRIRIPGVYNRSSPHSNAVHTTKYTILTFIPKNLWEQFHRFANIYFLFIVLLNFIPEVEAFGKEVAYFPLLFVLTVIAIKDIFEDYRRFRSDREINSKQCQVYNW